MAKSTGIVLTATGIAFTNEWLQDGTPNIRIPVAGLLVALIFDGIERLNERAGVGLAYIMLITATLAPINGKSPAQTLLDYSNAKQGKVPK